MDWPKDLTIWTEQDGRQCMSVPFTWLLPKAQRYINSFAGPWLVGGPAVRLMPDYLHGCTIGVDYPGVLQRVHPEAMRTTYGCPRCCPFCGVSRICGAFRTLDDWRPARIVCDDNLLASSPEHIGRVLWRLRGITGVDFNQGLDCRLLKPWHAKAMAYLDKPILRLALDTDNEREAWARAVERLLTAGNPKSRIRTYVLCGFAGDVESDWQRCEYVESFGVKALPMWHHSLDCLHYGEVREDQEHMRWTKERQRQIMRWYYKHSGRKLIA